MKLQSRGHEVELIRHREVIDRDGTRFHQFNFAVDGKPTAPWEIPVSHRNNFTTDDEFDDYLARSAVAFSQSEYNQVIM
jgi:hypothetical protein